jgi:hypothetical protein
VRKSDCRNSRLEVFRFFLSPIQPGNTKLLFRELSSPRIVIRRGFLTVRLISPPLAGRHAEMFFERGVEKTKVLITAFNGDARNFDPRIRQQAAGVPEPQFDLMAA